MLYAQRIKARAKTGGGDLRPIAEIRSVLAESLFMGKVTAGSERRFGCRDSHLKQRVVVQLMREQPLVAVWQLGPL
jgi:hypothetical protein